MTDSPGDRHPHDDLRELIQAVPPMDGSGGQVDAKLDAFPGPGTGLGELRGYLAQIAAAQGRELPRTDRGMVAVFAGTHGVAGSRVTKTAQARVIGLTQGSAPVRGIAAEAGAAFKVYEFGLDAPSADLRREVSLSPRETAAAFAFGMEVVAEGADVIALGSVGPGAVTAAAAIARGLYGGGADYWAKGEGEIGRQRVADVQAAADRHSDCFEDPLAILSAFGGRDIAGLAGAILAARYQKIPIILDGFVTCAAAAVLHAILPASIAHCIAGHESAEFAQGALLDRMGLSPLHSFGIGVGDGTGAALALQTLKSAAAGLDAM